MATRLFVGNLSFSATEDALRECFAADGRQVVSVRIMVDRETGRSRGFAFVDMTNDEDARSAITALDGVDFGGRALRVSEAAERPERPGGGAPRRDGSAGPPRTASAGPRPSGGGGGGRRFSDAPRGGRPPEGRRSDRGPDRIKDDGGGKKPRRPFDDDDENEWE